MKQKVIVVIRKKLRMQKTKIFKLNSNLLMEIFQRMRLIKRLSSIMQSKLLNKILSEIYRKLSKNKRYKETSY